MPFTSPAEMVALRDTEERAAQRAYLPVFDSFVADLRTMAVQARAEDALVAAADPFVFTNVMTRWRAAIRHLAERRPESDALVLAALEASDIPLGLYEVVRDVLVASTVEGWSTWWTKVQLGRALIPRQGDTPRPLYRARVAGIARQAGTWATSSQVLGTGSRMRWVSRKDSRTRPSHREADGQTVPPNTPFMVGGYYLQGPGDPSGPPAETRGCRCVVVAVDD